MKKRNNMGYGNDWETPPGFYAMLDKEFGFDHDPCPLRADFDGLAGKWGKRNYCNPPYDRTGKEAFIVRAIQERKAGNLTVLLIPVSTSTDAFAKLFAVADEIRFVHRRLKFNDTKSSGMHDSMIVVLRPGTARKKVSLICHDGTGVT
jgi:hypothetical protein